MPDDTKPQSPGKGAWDATQWHEVVKGDTLSNPDVIRIGQKLRIP